MLLEMMSEIKIKQDTSLKICTKVYNNHLQPPTIICNQLQPYTTIHTTTHKTNNNQLKSSITTYKHSHVHP